jgi:hypothetical protein
MGMRDVEDAVVELPIGAGDAPTNGALACDGLGGSGRGGAGADGWKRVSVLS